MKQHLPMIVVAAFVTGAGTLYSVNHWGEWFPPDQIREPAQAIIDKINDDSAPWKTCYKGIEVDNPSGRSQLCLDKTYDNTLMVTVKGIDVTSELNDREKRAISAAMEARNSWLKDRAMRSLK